ncbi:phosphoenolpyruvate--protein phosphotransferase [Brachybacterium sp. YJGR34]|uniref:phosphoenolpyruvate--protein phosphotransferase n=1 Tax=Brachybacterium sp. YJGR34 TaxID=2059911 RepID=UPI000E0B9EED|nr:putative PEP-binding protein [Brachybacterium sp. YJGR34]
MAQHTGVPASPGRVLGTIASMGPPVAEPPAGERFAVGADPAREAERIPAAASAVRDALTRRAQQAAGEARAILAATAQMAADPTLLEAAQDLVLSEGLSPERAVWEAGEEIAATLAGLGGSLAERAADVRDVRARLVAALRGEQPPGLPETTGPVVLTAIDLAPADTATLDPERVLALLTAEGGPQSHTAILARQLGLPAVVAVRGIEEITDGTEVFVDGAAGTVTDEVTAEHRRRAAAWSARQLQPLTGGGGRGTLADGTRVELLANVGGAADAAHAAARADGVGLLRTELLFLDRAEEPGVEEQAAAYGAVLAHFPGRTVVIRTLDAGADKPLPFLPSAEEPNPALGVRGWRIAGERPGVVDRQLEAIAVAAERTGSRPWVMAPMIATVTEAEDFAARCRQRGLVPSGVTVETPAAALTADRLLQVCDFLSIGTNDLTQYTMAADRQLGSLAHLTTAWQPAVLALVRAACEGARSAAAAAGVAKPVGVCGEAAGDPGLAVVLVGLGASSLSMAPRSLPAVSAVLAEVTLDRARELADRAVTARTAEEAAGAVRAALPILDELGL